METLSPTLPAPGHDMTPSFPATSLDDTPVQSSRPHRIRKPNVKFSSDEWELTHISNVGEKVMTVSELTDILCRVAREVGERRGGGGDK